MVPQTLAASAFDVGPAIMHEKPGCGGQAMPVHDWTRVDAGIFHAFHQQYMIAISNALNSGLLPEDYYALPEQHAAGFGPDVLTLQGTQDEEDDSDEPAPA